MKNVVSGYSKTVVSHCRGCIFQGFQSLQKVGKTSSEIDSKCPKILEKWFGEFPKTQFKTAMKNTENLMKKGLQNEV